jgi:uncharacterized protein YkwD
MNSPSPRKAFSSRSITRWIAISALSLCACGGGEAQLDKARWLLDRGQLDEAEEALAGLSGAPFERVVAEIERAREERAGFEAELARLSELQPREELKALRDLQAEVEGAHQIEQLEQAISSAADRAAEEGGRSRVANRAQPVERQSRDRQRLLVEEKASQVHSAASIDLVEAGEGEEGAAPSEPAPGDQTTVESVEELVIESLPAEEVGSALAIDAEIGSEVDAPSETDPAADQVQEERAEAELLELLNKQELLLCRASEARRDEVWESLIEHGELSQPHLKRALDVRWNSAARSLATGQSLKSLERVAQRRLELDHRREEALALIFNEEEYFYPYQPPDCPADKSRLYWPVQRRVEKLVEQLREVWERPREAKISRRFHQDLAELDWCKERARSQGHSLPASEELPSWLFLVNPEVRSLDSNNFAWDASEARLLANNAAVTEYNSAQWAKEVQKDLTEEQRADSEEKRQVEITNDYRRMFGRPALAWNFLLQASSAGHSDYMARTGEFGHYEKGNPDRESPFDRMQLVGYNYGISENCHLGGGSAQGAHEGWCKSSGHHRNLLMAGHSEMGSARNSRYWTQNFGTGQNFQNDIESWQD